MENTENLLSYGKWFVENYDVKYENDFDMWGIVTPKAENFNNFNTFAYFHPELVRAQIMSDVRHQVKQNEENFVNDKMDQRKSNTDYVFVTVNLDEVKYDVRKFFPLVSRYVTLCFVSEWKYVFEQRGESDNDFHGVHAHIFFKRTRKPSEVKKETQRFFKPCVGNLNAINVQYIEKSDFEKVVNYIEGKKHDTVKHKKQDNDVLFRKNFGLQTIYTHEDLL